MPLQQDQGEGSPGNTAERGSCFLGELWWLPDPSPLAFGVQIQLFIWLLGGQP